MSRGGSRDAGLFLGIAAALGVAALLEAQRRQVDAGSVDQWWLMPGDMDATGYTGGSEIVEYVTAPEEPASFTPQASYMPEHQAPEVSFVNPLSIIRGIRNNNPGNIRLGQPWQGLRDTQTDGAFAQFVSMEYGIRAIAKVLFTYAEKYGLRSVAGIISRWAPTNENDTAGYINFVSGQMNVDPLATINVRDPETLFKLIRAIVRQENGYLPSLAVSDAAVRGGIQLALNG